MGFFDPEQHTLSELSALYKTVIAKKNKEELVAFLSELKDYAELFRQRIPAFDRSTNLSFGDTSQRLLHILDVLQISTFHPFILFLMRKHADDEPQLLKVLTNLEKFIMRAMISKAETKNYNKICKELIGDPSLLDTKVSEIKDQQLAAGLQSMANKNGALVLFWIELFRRQSDPKFDEKELKYAYTLEHIMPQKWEEFWSVVPVKDSLGQPITNLENAKKLRYQKIYEIGNMTLLNGSLNPALRNFAFEKKVTGDGKRKGMKSYASLSITRDDVISKYDSGDKTWDETTISSRTQALTKEVLTIWG